MDVWSAQIKERQIMPEITIGQKDTEEGWADRHESRRKVGIEWGEHK